MTCYYWAHNHMTTTSARKRCIDAEGCNLNQDPHKRAREKRLVRQGVYCRVVVNFPQKTSGFVPHGRNLKRLTPSRSYPKVFGMGYSSRIVSFSEVLNVIPLLYE